MHEHQEQNPSRGSGNDVGREESRDELSGFLRIGLADQQQHRGSERGTELRETEYVGQCHAIGDDIEQPLHPFAQGLGQQGQYHANQIEVEEQLRPSQFVGMSSRVVGHRDIGTDDSQHEHKDKEGCVFPNGFEKQS